MQVTVDVIQVICMTLGISHGLPLKSQKHIKRQQVQWLIKESSLNISAYKMKNRTLKFCESCLLWQTSQSKLLYFKMHSNRLLKNQSRNMKMELLWVEL